MQPGFIHFHCLVGSIRMLFPAISIFQTKTPGYNAYHYRKYGFIDKSISFDNRKQKSIEYFEKARDIYESKLMYGAVTNIYYSLSLLYYWNHQQKEACDALEKSLESHLKFKRSNPGVRITLPDGFSSYEAYVDAAKKECGCI